MNIMKTIALLLIIIIGNSFTTIAGSQEDLIEACKQGNLKAVQKAISKGAVINKDLNGSTAISSCYFSAEVTKWLIDNGANVNSGAYPSLLSAISNYSIEVIKLLLDAEADPNKTAIVDPGWALRKHIAAERAKGDAANEAIIASFEKAMEGMKKTALSAIRVSMNTNCVPCLKMLFEKGAKVIENDPAGDAIFIIASMSASKEERRERFASGKAAMESLGLKISKWYGDLGR
jgi:ankyrin repeat protein